MSLINYNGYFYYDDKDNNDSFYEENSDDDFVIKNRFDQKHLDTLISSGEFQEAHDYLSKYHWPNNPKFQKSINNKLALLEYNASKMQAIHSRILDNDKLDKVKLGEAIENGSNFDLTGNKYYDQFNGYWRNIGSNTKETKRDDGSIIETPIDDKNEATSLKITFRPTKNYLFGIDWLAKDNPYGIEALYDKMGIKQEDLEKAGIYPKVDSDGNTTISFSKNNPLAMKIMYSLPNQTYDNGTFEHSTFLGRLINSARGVNTFEDIPTITGINNVGKEIKTEGYNYIGHPTEVANPMILATRLATTLDSGVFGNEKNPEDFGKYNLPTPLPKDYQRFKAAYYNAITAKQDTYKELKEDNRIYHSTRTYLFDDEINLLKNDYYNGRISKEDFWRYYKDFGEYRVLKAIKGLGSSDVVIYSNMMNPDVDTMEKLDISNNMTALNIISAADPKDINLYTQLTDGKYGIVVSIEAHEDKKTGKIIPRREFLFPGLFLDEAQAAMARNTSTRSNMQINAMQNYGTTYKTVDGNVISYVGNNAFALNDELIDLNRATRLIDKDMIVSDAKRALPFKHLNGNNQVNVKSYSEQALITAIAAANELYPDIEFRKLDGTPFTAKELFEYQSATGDVTEEGRQLMSMETVDKVLDFYDVYNKILDELKFFYITDSSNSN